MELLVRGRALPWDFRMRGGSGSNHLDQVMARAVGGFLIQLWGSKRKNKESMQVPHTHAQLDRLPRSPRPICTPRGLWTVDYVGYIRTVGTGSRIDIYVAVDSGSPREYQIHVVLRSRASLNMCNPGILQR